MSCREVLGKSIRLNGEPHSIIGVLAPQAGFHYPSLGVPEPVDIYVPFLMNDAYTLRSSSQANVRRVRVLARLSTRIPGLTAGTLGLGLDHVGCATLAADIASMRHETQYTRLFRS